MKKIILMLLTSASLSAAPEAIVFDFGGVMTGKPDKEVVIDFLCHTLNLSLSEFEKANLEKREAIKSGKTEEQFWREFANINEIRLSVDWSSRFKSVMKEAVRASPEMYGIVNQLRQKKILVAMLSNIDERRSKLIREFGLYEPFHPCLLSCEIGVEKPDSRAYEILIDRLDLPSESILLIDDRLENVEGAVRMGLDAILFESPEQIYLELKNRCLL